MTSEPKHLPQIEYYLVIKGYQVFPFIGEANLSTLIRWRREKLANDNPFFAGKDSRQTYLNHMECMERCIGVLFSCPTPEYAIEQLNKQKKESKQIEKLMQIKANEFLNSLSEEQRTKLENLAKKFFR
jgi:hypothetical protein